jgi:hypothetical protein
MKSTVTANPFLFCLLIALFSLPVGGLRADNSCDCQNPPGGHVQCEANQVAICKIVNGHVVAECHTPPENAKQGFALEAWTLSKVIGKDVNESEVKKPEFQMIWSSKYYKSPDGSKEVLFKAPML